MTSQDRRDAEDEHQDQYVYGVRDAWTTIDETLSSEDEGKAKDSQDDLDSLLVFAGLYSAVLTAFLVQSYKSLLPDPKEDLLRQIAFQTANYSFSGGYLNSTFRASQLPAFQAALSDVRVNVCWFASLILSLTTASYGILVKQWLRQYLAIGRTEPQERIRIRHFRARGLQEWKLFDIAAILPIILQISLTLFFVGLCFFTTAVHESVGLTSVCLVSGWAFFFGFAILAPLVSARCPYKTRTLRVAFRRLRPHIRRSFKCFTKRLRRKDLRGRLHLQYSIDRIVVGDEDEEDQIRRNESDDLDIFRNVDSILQNDKLLATMQEILKQGRHSGDQLFQFAVAALQQRLGLVQDMSQDSLRDTFRFIARMRGSLALSHTARTSLINIVADSLLSELSRTSVKEWIDSDPRSTLRWTQDAITLILTLSLPRSPMLKSVTSVFERLFQVIPGHYPSLAQQILSAAKYAGSDAGNWPTRVLSCIVDVLKSLDTDDAAWAFQCIVHRGYVDLHENIPLAADTYGRLLARSADGESGDIAPATNETIVVLLEVAAMILHTLTAEDISNDRLPAAFPQSIAALLDFVLKAIAVIKTNLPDVDLKNPRIRGGIGIDRVLVGLFTTPRLVYPFLEFFSTRFDVISACATDAFLLHPLGVAYRTDGVSREACVNILSACADYFSAKTNSNAPLDLVTVLHLSRLIYMFDTPHDQETLKTWHRMFSNVTACIDKLHSHSELQDADECQGDRHTETCQVAYRILRRLADNEHDVGHIPYFMGSPEATEDEIYSRWLKAFDVANSRVPDTIVKLLHGLVCGERENDEYGRKFWRIRRLEHIEARAKPTSVTEGDPPRQVPLLTLAAASPPPSQSAFHDLEDMYAEPPAKPESKAGSSAPTIVKPTTASPNPSQCHSDGSEDVHDVPSRSLKAKLGQLALRTPEREATSAQRQVADPAGFRGEQSVNPETEAEPQRFASGMHTAPPAPPLPDGLDGGHGGRPSNP